MSVLNPIIDYIDGENRRIYLKAPADFPTSKIGDNGQLIWNPIDDIYSEERALRASDENLRKFDKFVSAIPLFDKGAGKKTGRGLILLKGTVIVPFDVSQEQIITGELLSDDGNSGASLIVTDTLSSSSKIKLNYEPPPTTEIVEVIKNGLTSEQLRQAIIDGLTATTCE